MTICKKRPRNNPLTTVLTASVRVAVRYRVLICCTFLTWVAPTVCHAGLVVGSIDNGNCYPFSCGPTDQVTEYQQVYAATSFPGAISITSLSFYAWSGNTTKAMDAATYTVSLSTTIAPVSGLSANLAANIGPDSQLFGTYTLGPTMPAVTTLHGAAFSLRSSQRQPLVGRGDFPSDRRQRGL